MIADWGLAIADWRLSVRALAHRYRFAPDLTQQL